MNKAKLLILFAVGLFLLQEHGPSPNPGPPIVVGEERFLYRAPLALKPGHFPLNQGNVGTCVAFGHAAGVDIVNAMKVLNGKAKAFLPASPDSIYGGARNEAFNRASYSRQDGANGFGAVAWLTKEGGVLPQKPYPEHGVDLSSYSTTRSRDYGYWGNGGKGDGIGGPFDNEAKKTPLPGAAKVTNEHELREAMRLFKPVTICSNIGFNSPRDKDGFCKPSGSWSHCMCIVGYREGGRPGYLVLNSWGPYITGDGPNSKNKYQDQPDGSFYIEPSVAVRILKQGDSWALSGDAEFRADDAPEWLTIATAEPPEMEPEVAPQEITPDPISTPEASASLVDKIDGLLKPVPVEEFKPLAKPEAASVAATGKQALQVRCGPNGCYAPTRRRFFFR
jgi:hypothetical protein